jgi:hypothetical protein
MILRWYNRNIVGTHFGGSLCSMIDPHFMLLLMQLLGKGYFVWDKASDIEFIKASTDEVTAVFKISVLSLMILSSIPTAVKSIFLHSKSRLETRVMI